MVFGEELLSNVACKKPVDACRPFTGPRAGVLAKKVTINRHSSDRMLIKPVSSSRCTELKAGFCVHVQKRCRAAMPYQLDRAQEQRTGHLLRPESGCSGAAALLSMQPVTSRLLEPEAVPVHGVLKPRGRSYEELCEKAVVARRTLRTTVLAAELLHLSICAALLTSEALAAAIANDGMLFRGSHGFEEAVSMSLLALSPILSALATAVLCCRDLAVDPGLSPAFALLALFAAAEACFLAVSSAGTDRAMKLVCDYGAPSFTKTSGSADKAKASTDRGSTQLRGCHRERGETQRDLRDRGETLALPVQSCALLDFEELDYQSASLEEWKQKLLEQLRATLGFTDEASRPVSSCHMQAQAAEGPLLVRKSVDGLLRDAAVGK
eukprot:s596_g4.t1